MKKTLSKTIAKFLQRATLLIAGSALAVSATYGQGGGPGGNSGQCSVTQIRLRIVTGGDDLRGGKDNLNIQILFAGGRAPQVALNVNKSQNWPNNSTNTVDIPLNQPVPPNQIIGLRLIHIADGGFNFNSLPSVLTPAAPWEIPQAFLSPDNWDMSLLQVAAIGNGVGARIAGHGFNRFTGSNPILTVATHVPANACGSGRPAGNSGGGSGGTGPTSFQPLIPRSGSNTGSGGALPSLQPLIPRGSANTGPGSGTGAQQAQKPLTTAPRPVPNVMTPGPQPHRQQGQRQPGQGVVEGYVYWDASVLKHSPPDGCVGLSVTVSRGGIPLVTMTDNFAYIGNVGSDAVCRYAVKGLPVEEDLQVQANVTSPAAFSPAALPSGGSKSITLTTGTPACAPGGPVNPSQSDLSSGWSSCADVASNVNFVLVPARLLAPLGARMPYPPKNSTLLTSGEQKTLLGDGSVRPTPAGTVGPSQTMSAQGNASSNAGPTPVPSKGHGKNQYEAMTLDRGVTRDKAFSTWANSTQAPGKGSPSTSETNPTINVGGTGVSTVSAPRPVSSLAAMGRVPSQVNLQVASACAKDPSFRILFISGIPDGKTLTVGRQYTLWGCSFGNMPAAKRPTPPPTSPSQNQTASYPSYYNVAVWTSQPFIAVDAQTVSWSDNAIVVTFSPRPANHPGPSTTGLVLPAQVLVTRGDGQTRIYGSEGGVYFRLVN